MAETLPEPGQSLTAKRRRHGSKRPSGRRCWPRRPGWLRRPSTACSASKCCNWACGASQTISCAMPARSGPAVLPIGVELRRIWGPGRSGTCIGCRSRSESVDVVLLPHTLDYSDDRSHAVLREADRVLTPHGHLVILGFKPGGLWGLRRLIPGAGLPPGGAHLIPDRRLSDWLQLLDMRILGISRYFFRWPLPGNKGQSSAEWENRGRRFWPELAACYMLSAQKRVVTMTPVKKPWRTRAKVVGSIVEPTTRASRIRFDRNR